jgi:hypothetical protein
MYATNTLMRVLMFLRRFWDADPVSIELLIEKDVNMTEVGLQSVSV